MVSKHQPGPVGMSPRSGGNLNDGTMIVGRSPSKGILGGQTKPREEPPKYAFLSFAHILSYLPPEDEVAVWHTVVAGEDFWTIAALHHVPVEKIIAFNFPASVENGRVIPAIVNWYLNHHLSFGCPMTQDHLNRIFRGGEKIAIPFVGNLSLGNAVIGGEPDEAKRRTRLRDYAIQLSTGPTKCERLVKVIAKSALLVDGLPNPDRLMIDDLEKVLIGESLTQRGTGTYWAGFNRGASGFQTHLQDQSDQSAHAMAGIIIGYRHWGATEGLVKWQETEAQDDSLYDATFPLGDSLDETSYKGLAERVRKAICIP